MTLSRGHLLMSVLLAFGCQQILLTYASTQDIFYFRTKDSNKLINDAKVEIGSSYSFLLQGSQLVSAEASLHLMYDEGDGKGLSSTSTQLSLNVTGPFFSNNQSQWFVVAKGVDPGHVTLVLSGVNDSATNTSYNVSKAFVRFQIYHSQPLTVLSDVIGWMYFVAWSISFYPQAILNFRRKSVVGLNFDFLGFNAAGFACYTIYNVGLFWIPAVKADFTKAHPHDITPVEVNDVVFAIHALTLTLVTIIQVFIYEKGGQRVSIVARVILGVCGLAALIFVIIAAIPSVNHFNWLDMVTSFSYVKLAITIIKYIPQAWMNFRRKSTVGWSIGNVLLDFTGGTCSIIQMFILAYNFNDWASIFLNPVKFWLGALSIIFDVIFMVQHYILYRHAPYTNLKPDDSD